MAVQGLTNSGAFHVVGGRNVELSQEKTVALIGGTWTFKPPLIETGRLDPVLPIINTRRLVFSHSPINFGDTFQVYVTQRKHQAHKIMLSSPPHYTYKFVPEDKSCSKAYTQQNMGIGFIACDPFQLLTLPEDDGIAESWHFSPDVWMLSGDMVYHDGRKEAKHNLRVYKPNNETIGCRVNEKGYLEFIKDSKNHGVVWSKPLPMDRPLWGFVDLPIEYKIKAQCTYGQGPPPPYKPSVDQNPDPQSDTNQRLEQKIADLEAIMKKNSQEMHHMKQELASNFQKQLMDMQQQVQTQLTQLKTCVQNLKP